MKSQTNEYCNNQLVIFIIFTTYFFKGEYLTTAQWMRGFVMNHADYKQDSVVTESIAYDLVKLCHEISNKGRPCPELFGKPETRTSLKGPDCTMNGDKMNGKPNGVVA